MDILIGCTYICISEGIFILSGRITVPRECICLPAADTPQTMSKVSVSISIPPAMC